MNTVCENALITAFARRLTVVPPDIIDGVAYDLRLAPTDAQGIEPSASSNEELETDEDTALTL